MPGLRELLDELHNERVWRAVAERQRDCLARLVRAISPQHQALTEFPRMESYVAEKEVNVTVTMVGKGRDGDPFHARFVREYDNVKLSGFDIFQAKASEAAFKLGELDKAGALDKAKVAGEKRVDVVVTLEGKNSEGFRMKASNEYDNMRLSAFNAMQALAEGALFEVGATVSALKAKK